MSPGIFLRLVYELNVERIASMYCSLVQNCFAEFETIFNFSLLHFFSYFNLAMCQEKLNEKNLLYVLLFIMHINFLSNYFYRNSFGSVI